MLSLGRLQLLSGLADTTNDDHFCALSGFKRAHFLVDPNIFGLTRIAAGPIKAVIFVIPRNIFKRFWSDVRVDPKVHVCIFNINSCHLCEFSGVPRVHFLVDPIFFGLTRIAAGPMKTVLFSGIEGSFLGFLIRFSGWPERAHLHLKH